MIGRAPDATSFLSTTTALVGVFVAIVGTALVQFLFQDDSRSDHLHFGSSRARSVVLASLLAVDVWGVGFPLYALYLNTIGPVSGSLVRAVFVSSTVVVAANIFLPVNIYQLYRSVRVMREWTRTDRLDNEKSIQAMRANLVDGGYLSAEDFDSVMEEFRGAGRVSGDHVSRFFMAMFRSVILARPDKFGITIGRTIAYYAFAPLVRKLLSSGQVEYVSDEFAAELSDLDENGPSPESADH